MKRGTTFILPVSFDIDLDDVEKIEFIFKQGVTVRKLEYPSTNAVRVTGTNTVNILWTRTDTYKFDASKDIGMDTRITLTDIETNPETRIQTFSLARTLFPAEEVTT